jgi:hypothetical protein
MDRGYNGVWLHKPLRPLGDDNSSSMCSLAAAIDA